VLRRHVGPQGYQWQSGYQQKQEHQMTSAAIDTDDWLAAIAGDPGLTTRDLMAGYYYTDDAETDLTDDQLQESFDKLVSRGYFGAVLVLDEHASLDVRKTLPKAKR
jgi:2-hydroxychromene-2-carboxylate isomerase